MSSMVGTPLHVVAIYWESLVQLLCRPHHSLHMPSGYRDPSQEWGRQHRLPKSQFVMDMTHHLLLEVMEAPQL
jgi:hypothetical protein